MGSFAMVFSPSGALSKHVSKLYDAFFTHPSLTHCIIEYRLVKYLLFNFGNWYRHHPGTHPDIRHKLGVTTVALVILNTKIIYE